MSQLEEELILERTGKLGMIQLNRPQALNALSLRMLQGFDKQLHEWATDDAIHAVFVVGAGERAFCAGADVKSIYMAGAGNPCLRNRFAADYFRVEYTLDHRIATFPKPYISCLDGIVMGGGVGISIWGSHRIATERTLWAMPETGIGFFPDVGASYFLSHLGPLGRLLGLTGQTLTGMHCLKVGFATHYVPELRVADIGHRIDQEGVDAVLNAYQYPLRADPKFHFLQELAETCFAGSSVLEIVQRLQQLAGDPSSDLDDLAADTLKRLRERSPTSLAVTLEQLKRGRELSLKECLKMEYRICYRCVHGHDFYEGVRAVLIDKDRSPRWLPRLIEEIEAWDMDEYFADLGEQELMLV